MQYLAMTLYSKIANVLSWIAAGASFVFGILALASMASGPFGSNVWGGILAMLLAWVLGFFGWLGIRIIPEVLQLLMRLEANTRR